MFSTVDTVLKLTVRGCFSAVVTLNALSPPGTVASYVAGQESAVFPTSAATAGGSHRRVGVAVTVLPFDTVGFGGEKVQFSFRAIY